jgi:sugar/nucleoside kinase (ribokinase family)
MKKVLGIGNALVDIMTILREDQILEQFKLPKGSMQLVSHDMAEQILSTTKDYTQSFSSGGSAANTIHGLAHLGIPCAYIGKVGRDTLGDFFHKDLIDNNIRPILFHGKAESGQAIALVSPDSERTFATYLGAAIELYEGDLSAEMFSGYDYLHIEGYLVQNHDLIRKALQLAKEASLTISLDTASYNVVEANKNFLIEIIRDFVDILFANEEEAKMLTGEEPFKALSMLSALCETAIVKIGAKGSLIQRKNKTHKIAATDVHSIDTTGAGDLYASGFLYGLIHNYPLEQCGHIASILAGNVIEVIGAKMNKDRWEKIQKAIHAFQKM